MSGIFDNFGYFIEQDRGRTPCLTCQLFADNPDVAAEIRGQIATRGLYKANGRPAQHDPRVRLKQIAAYIEGKFPGSIIKYHNVIDHFRCHEEAR